MDNGQSADEIREIAMKLDNALARRNIDVVLDMFTNDCEIELLGIRLIGKDGAARWINWLYKHLSQVEFVPVTIMVDGNTFFEEFEVRAKLRSGMAVQSKQTEVLVFENSRVKSLRLYFDRLDFANSIANDPISKLVIRQLLKASLKGLTGAVH